MKKILIVYEEDGERKEVITKGDIFFGSTKIHFTEEDDSSGYIKLSAMVSVAPL